MRWFHYWLGVRVHWRVWWAFLSRQSLGFPPWHSHRLILVP